MAAVDPKIAEKIYQNVVCGLLAGKTRFLVTHHVAKLENADRIICLENERGIIFNGKYNDFYEGNTNVLESISEPERSSNLTNKKTSETLSCSNDSNDVKIDSAMKLWWNYFLISGSNIFIGFWLVTLILCQVLQVLTDLQLAKFASEGDIIRQSCEVNNFALATLWLN